MSDFPDFKTISSYGDFTQRWFFLVDRQGIVRGRWNVNSKEVLPSEVILEAVRKLAEKS